MIKKGGKGLEKGKCIKIPIITNQNGNFFHIFSVQFRYFSAVIKELM